ncbi:MAG: hypothetical protein N2378_11485 [Chloroflexaceae bacterium]|nr:hypothetical protein [Chloroflexaceae bacterium]
MRMRTWTATLVFTLIVLLGGARVTARPLRPGEAPAQASTPLETLLNPDGSLRLDGSFSGALDVSGWQVTLDPEQGPIFQPQSGPPRWTSLGSGTNGALNNSVYALAVSGGNVYVGGYFTNAGGIPEADYVARWDGMAWSALGGSGGTGAINGPGLALALGSSNLYVGGNFSNAAGIPEADNVARWDGTAWRALGGSGNGALNNTVYALAASGNNLYEGGVFQNAAGIPEADRVARWDGSAWSALGGSGDSGALNNAVYTLAVSGGNLYAGGTFRNAAGILEADYVARWDGTAWRALGGSGDGALNGVVAALAVSGGNLYVGGAFTNVAGIPEADNVARWDGTAWRALGGSGDGAVTGPVNALALSGGDVYVGGPFINAAGIAEADYVARWDGANWSALGGSGNGVLFSDVFALAASGSDVFVGGPFTNIGGNPAADYIVAYAVPPSVSAITRLSPDPTTADSVQFQVAFDEPVTGVAAGDFALTTTGGLSGASVTSVSGSGATYTVTVVTGTGNGTLRLDVPAGATITDLAGLSPNNLPFTVGATYTVNRGGAPTPTPPGGGSPTPTPPGGDTPTPTPPGGDTPTPTPPGDDLPVRVYLPLAQR